MLYVKGDYYVNEYVTALKHAMELALPIEAHSDTYMNDENVLDKPSN